MGTRGGKGWAERKRRRELERQRRKARKEHRKRDKRVAVPPATSLDIQSAPRRFSLRFGSAIMAQAGPLITGMYCVPAPLAERLRDWKKPVPDPVVGFLLVDTGASRTCIDRAVAKRLGLSVVDSTHTYGSSGRHEVELYRAHLRIHIVDGPAVTELNVNLQAAGIRDLTHPYRQMGLTVSGQGLENEPVELIGLIGRDLLQHARMIYDGPNGVLDMEFDTTRFPTFVAGARPR